MPLGQAVEMLINGVRAMGEGNSVDPYIQNLAKRTGHYVSNIRGSRNPSLASSFPTWHGEFWHWTLLSPARKSARRRQKLAPTSRFLSLEIICQRLKNQRKRTYKKPLRWDAIIDMALPGGALRTIRTSSQYLSAVRLAG